jgi:hypothetical protein
MGTSSVIMALPSEGGTAEMVINDFYDCGNYQGHFDFDTFSVDIKYTKTKRYHITVKAQPNWLNNMAQIERDIEIFGEGFFTLHLTLVEKFKVEDELTINPKAEHYIFGIDYTFSSSIIIIFTLLFLFHGISYDSNIGSLDLKAFGSYLKYLQKKE